MEGKNGEILNQVVIQIILIAIILALFLFSTAGKINGEGVKQQVLEKQIALLIDSGIPGMDFEVSKININGKITNVRVSEGRIFIDVDGVLSLKGYPYFSKYEVVVTEVQDKFVVGVR